MKRNIFFVTVCFIVVFTSCGGVDVVYDVPFEQMVAGAEETGQDFCVVIARTDCPPCAEYVKSLRAGNRGAFPKITYNIVDVSLPENKWYTHWLCTGAFPATCLFSADGRLKAVIASTTNSAVECLRSAVDGDAKCADYLYDKHYHVLGNYLAMLNDLLACKRDLEAGKDIGTEIDACLAKAWYPYPVYLKALNEQRQGRTEGAAEMGRQLLAFDEQYYYYVYNDLFTQAKYIIDPDYTPSEDAVLTMTEEIELDGCEVGKPRQFRMEVTNTGKFPLTVRDVQLSCTCLKLLTPARFRLEPGESSQVVAEFTAEGHGEFYREIVFFSDAAETMQRVAVRARAAR